MSTVKEKQTIKWEPRDKELNKNTGEIVIRSYAAPERLMRIAVNRLSNPASPEWVLLQNGTIAGTGYKSAKAAMEAAEKL